MGQIQFYQLLHQPAVEGAAVQRPTRLVLMAVRAVGRKYMPEEVEAPEIRRLFLRHKETMAVHPLALRLHQVLLLVVVVGQANLVLIQTQPHQMVEKVEMEPHRLLLARR
jgi:hypothetical protein